MNTKLIFSIICPFCFFYKAAFTQQLLKPLALNSIYVEALGMGGYGSINYERFIYQQKKLHIGVRLGVGTYRLRDFETNLNPDITIPFALNAYYGKTHHAEVGIGQTFTSIVGASTVDFRVNRQNSLSSNFTVGYRYQKSNGGMMVRVNYSPIVSINQSFKHWYGLSVGYSF
ncbi:hypothetical protein [Emticicia sp. BO119]|uniref:hypothetical protein n=1 Tax=Emticicia sp. BO119 TaxID=2757768 RepID=UPI0015F0C876|nr:hypothetical protein [Emticicia sp. BO119]MBA4852466.1 hypothetical protein [Emticicia sp. BO119]